MIYRSEPNSHKLRNTGNTQNIPTCFQKRQKLCHQLARWPLQSFGIHKYLLKNKVRGFPKRRGGRGGGGKRPTVSWEQHMKDGANPCPFAAISGAMVAQWIKRWFFYLAVPGSSHT